MANHKRQTNKMCRKNKLKTTRHNSKRRMKGGANFSEENRRYLIADGFTNAQINFLELRKMTNMNIIRSSRRQINPKTGAFFTPNELIQDLNELEYTDNEASDTNDDDDIASGKRTRKNKIKTIGHNSKRIKHIQKKQKKTRSRSRNQRGGICYGNGIGSNTNNPNLSIYNTDLLKLFPYRP